MAALLRGSSVPWAIATHWAGRFAAATIIFASLAVSGSAASKQESDKGVSNDLIAARMAFGQPPMNVLSLRSFDRLFETEAVRAVKRPILWERSGKPFKLEYQFEGKPLNMDQFLERTYTNALVVVHDGKIVAEHYRNGMTAKTPHATFSISKSLVSMLVGIAISRGEIDSIDTEITRYAPEFKGTAYEGVTLRQALQMRSGVDFNEDGAPFFAFLEKVIANNELRCADFIKTAKRLAAPGDRFNYSSPETCVIARVLERATGQALAAYMERHLWQPIRMEHGGYWVLDGKPGQGTAIANGGFAASARDLAKIGQLMLNRGQLGSKQIVPESWVAASTSTDGDAAKAQTDGYGYQWWTLGDPSAFAGVGINGQYLYVVPSQDLVIVKYSYWPTGGDEKLEAETLAAFQAIGSALN
jgi:CubicO group peptidase (beta-lactamase class C family)